MFSKFFSNFISRGSLSFDLVFESYLEKSGGMFGIFQRGLQFTIFTGRVLAFIFIAFF